MASDNHIKQFTATDIEKYHQGILSPKERHALEKAALDDPFLADALEGYSVAGVNAAADIAELKKRLAEKTEGAKVIAMQTAPRNSFRSLRAAIMILFIAGAGLLVYKLGFDKKKNEVAKLQSTDNSSKQTDTGKVVNPTEGTVSIPVDGIKKETKPVTTTNEQPHNFTTIEDSGKKEVKAISPSGGDGYTFLDNKRTAFDDVTVNNKPTTTQPTVTAPTKTADEKNNDWYKVDADKVEKKIAERKELAKEDAAGKQRSKEEALPDALKDQQVVSQQNNRNYTAATNNTRRADQVYNYSNTFRGRVTDGDNNGVPFANVTNVQDNNAGTYTDAKGFFNLTYPDSVLTVQVRSVGFENNNVQLRNSVPNNQVILQDDRKSLSEVVVSKQKINASSSASNRDSTMKLETPEPADGWANYNTYVLNNLEVPEDLKNKPTTESGEVQVSFEIDKNGEPTNIKVVKSLCKKCDQEAIRLIKEGPKWKRNANKKGKTTVTINF